MGANPILEDIQNSCKELKEKLGPFASLATGRRIQKGLNPAIVFPLDDEQKLPTFIALIGPSGAGKSTLFNMIIERPGESDVGIRRPTTLHPIIACPTEHYDLVKQRFDNPTWNAKIIRCDEIDFILIDAPDLDSYVEQNKQLAQMIIEWSDVLTLVIHKEEVANYELSELIREWSKKKHWFFVMNKIENLNAQKRQKLQANFDWRLEEKGFKVDDDNRFIISAQDRDKGFEALNTAIKQERSVESLKRVRDSNFLGTVSLALEEDQEHTFDSIATGVQDEAKELKKSLWDDMQSQLLKTKYILRLMRLLRNRIWQHMPGKVAHPLSALLFVRAKFSGVMSGFYGMRIASRGVSPWNLLRFSQSTISAMKGDLECRTLLRSLAGSAEIKEKLDEQKAKVDDYLTEHRLDDLDMEQATEKLRDNTSRVEDEELPVGMRQVLNLLERVLPGKKTTTEEDQIAEELAPLLDTFIETTADDVASNATKFYHKLLNLLPVAALLHISWIISTTWFLRDWLEPKFYLQSVAIFIVSIIPGYMVLSWSVRRHSRSDKLEELLTDENSSWNCDKAPANGDIRRLEAVDERISSITVEIDQLRQRVNQERELLKTERGPAAYGITKI